MGLNIKTYVVHRIGRFRPYGYRVVVLAVFAVAGTVLLTQSRAATYNSAGEPEAGVVSGNASKILSAAASGGGYVNFGVAGSAPLSTPANIKVFVGGNSIAIRWGPSTSSGTNKVAKYMVIRDGVQIATVDPTVRNIMVQEVNNCGYIDSNVSSGSTYKYQIQAQDDAGLVSGPSVAVTATQPTTSQPLTIAVDASGDQTQVNYLNNTVAPFLKTWYPKVAAVIANGNYVAQSSITLKISPAHDYVYTEKAVGSSKNTMSTSSKWIASSGDDMGQWLFSATCLIRDYPIVTDKDDCYRQPTLGPLWLPRGIDVWATDNILHNQDRTLPLIYNYNTDVGSSSVLLQYIESTYGPGVISKINKAVRAGSYTDSLWQTYTNRTIDQLSEDMLLRYTTQDDYITAPDGQCLGTELYSGENGQLVYPRSCHTSNTWRLVYFDTVGKDLSKGFHLALHSSDQCMDVPSNYNDPGVPMFLQDCGKNQTQWWKVDANGALVNMYYNLCLQTETYTVTNVTVSKLRACDGSAIQRWQLPKNQR